jgi:RNA polymerase sigma-70 factor (ECF subfamily)
LPSDPSKFRALVYQYTRLVYGLAYEKLMDPEEARDVTQDVFMRIFKHFESYRGESTLSTWISEITIRRSQSRLRQITRRRQFAEKLTDQASMATPDPDPEQLYLQSEESDVLHNLVARLPEPQRTAIHLFYVAEKSYEEISQILHIPTGTIATILHRGRERLRELIEQEQRQLPG